jgi:uncharacterized repeat protein (TIGR01451 family)
MAAPSVTSFSPAFGSSSDGEIEILGSGFLINAGTTNFVRFGPFMSSHTFASTTGRLLAKVPAGTPINTNVSINVSNSTGSFTLANPKFTIIGSGPYIADFTPSSGDAGTVVDITGTHFVGSGGTITVSFNGVVAPITAETIQAEMLLRYKAPTGVSSGPIVVVRSGAGSSTSSVPFYVTPVVTNFNPSFGRTGTNVVIRGRNLLGANAVFFNGVQSPNITTNSPNQVTAEAPLNVTTGPIWVQTPAAGFVQSTSNFVVRPTILGFTPGFGIPGSSSITVTGANFNVTGLSVKFGGVQAANPSSVTFNSFVVAVPSKATNAPITVTTQDGTNTSAQIFYAPAGITDFSPTNGPEDTIVTITGNNFLGATAITFNGTSAKGFTSADATNNQTIFAKVPAGVITGPITITTPAGTTNSGTKWFFGIPHINSFNPTNGLPGTRVTVSGINFSNATQVLFNGIAAQFNVTNNSTLGATVPTNASSGPITVITPGGSHSSDDPFKLAYTSDLGVTASGPSSVLLATDFTYVIGITNRGPYAATNVVVSDTLPTSVTFKFGSISPGGTLHTGNNPITGTFPSIGVSNSASITLTVTPQVVSQITNVVSISSDYSDPVSTNNLSTVVTDIFLPAVLSIQPVSNQVRISWSVALSAFVLQSNTNLSSSVLWGDMTNNADVIGSERVIFDPIGPGSKFYRLRK